MKKLMFVLALLLVFPAAYAKDEDEKTGPKIQQVFVNFDSDHVVILGQDFLYDCEEPVLMIDGFIDPLVLVEPFYDDAVRAELPVLSVLPDGNYSLAITCNKETDRFDFAIGAIGPVGPIGPTGKQGPIGFTGANGKDGTDGKDGADGAAGPQGPEGPTGPAGPTFLEVNDLESCGEFAAPVGHWYGDCPETYDSRKLGTGRVYIDVFKDGSNCLYSKWDYYLLWVYKESGDRPGLITVNPNVYPKCLRLN